VNGIVGRPPAPILKRRAMPYYFSDVRLKVLLVRSALGVLFAFLLTRFFFRDTSIPATLVLAGLLVFFSYAFEYTRKK
jgi:hypothetical protein